MSGRSPARLLAPIALVSTFIAFFVVVTSGGEPETEATRSAQTDDGSRPTTTSTRQKSTKKAAKTYTVKPGDTPSGIADAAGISVETLLELNPDVDPQLLSPGQRLKLSP